MNHTPVAAAAAFADLAGVLRSGEVGGHGVDYVSWGFYEPGSWRNYPHTHSFHEVCLAYAGAGSFTVDGRRHPIEAGTAFLARPGVVHEIVADPARPLGIAFWGFSAQLPPSSARDGWWAGLTEPDRPVLSTRLGMLPQLVTALAAAAEPLCSGYEELARSLGAALVVETARAFALPQDLDVGAVDVDRSSTAVAVMRTFVEDNLARPLQVRDVAAAAHLSERQASRLFAHHVGTPMMAHVRRLRLERAAHLLIRSQDPLAQIGRECGYPEVRAFIAAFSRHFGQPPGAFRRRGGTLHLPA